MTEIPPAIPIGDVYAIDDLVRRVFSIDREAEGDIRNRAELLTKAFPNGTLISRAYTERGKINPTHFFYMWFPDSTEGVAFKLKYLDVDN